MRTGMLLAGDERDVARGGMVNTRYRPEASGGDVYGRNDRGAAMRNNQMRIAEQRDLFTPVHVRQQRERQANQANQMRLAEGEQATQRYVADAGRPVAAPEPGAMSFGGGAGVVRQPDGSFRYLGPQPQQDAFRPQFAPDGSAVMTEGGLMENPYAKRPVSNEPRQTNYPVVYDERSDQVGTWDPKLGDYTWGPRPKLNRGQFKGDELQEIPAGMPRFFGPGDIRVPHGPAVAQKRMPDGTIQYRDESGKVWTE